MIIIGGKEYELQFTMPVWDKMENELCMVEEFDMVMMQKGRLRKAAKLVSIMSVEPVKAEEIWEQMQPSDVRNIIGEAREVIRAALKMKVKTDEDENKVVDAVLEEIEKKETGAG
jgi:hypothetical protein